MSFPTLYNSLSKKFCIFPSKIINFSPANKIVKNMPNIWEIFKKIYPTGSKEEGKSSKLFLKHYLTDSLSELSGSSSILKQKYSILTIRTFYLILNKTERRNCVYVYVFTRPTRNTFRDVKIFLKMLYFPPLITKDR